METAASPALLAPLQDSPPHHLTECRENLKPRVSPPERVCPRRPAAQFLVELAGRRFITRLGPQKNRRPRMALVRRVLPSAGTTQSAGRGSRPSVDVGDINAAHRDTQVHRAAGCSQCCCAMLSGTSASNGPLSFGCPDTKMKSFVDSMNEAPAGAGCVWRIAGNEVGHIHCLAASASSPNTVNTRGLRSRL